MIYIVLYQPGAIIYMIESVWNFLPLAQSAIYYHAKQSNKNPVDYQIIQRELNFRSMVKP